MSFDVLALVGLIGATIALLLGVAVVAALCMAGRENEEKSGPRSYGTGAMAEKREAQR